MSTLGSYNTLSRLNPNSNASTGQKAGATEKDTLVANSPDDTISEVCWSNQANHLAASSWDNYVRVYDHTYSATGTGIASITFEAPVLSCHFSGNGQFVVGGGLDKSARLIDLAANGSPPQHVAAHEEAVKTVRFFDAPQSNSSMIATASWDKTIKYWDLRASTPAASITLPERVYSMDIKGDNLVAATPERKVYFIDLKNPTAFAKIVDSKISRQPRSILCMSRDKGFALGGVDARCEVAYFEEKMIEKNFTFRCHRSQIGATKDYKIYSVNSVKEHPTIAGIYSTAGSDGSFSFWHIPNRNRLFNCPAPAGGHSISATAFNLDGSLFAYAVSYDWAKGHAFHTTDYPHKIMIHQVGDECKSERK